MSMAAILVLWTRPLEQTFIPQSHWGSIWNLTLIGLAVLEKIFENGGRTTDTGPWPYYKLTNEPKGSGELKSHVFSYLFLTSIAICVFINSDIFYDVLGSKATFRWS